MPKPHPYALIGFLLGWGGPAGFLAARYLWSERLGIQTWTWNELQTHAWMYLYMMISTPLIFSLFGSWAGNRLTRFMRRIAVLEKSGEQLSELSMTDGLTGLYNHRYLQERLELEVQRAARYQTPLAVLMVDIDDFKRLNDTYGHLFGDHALKHLATLLLQTTRRIDIVGRYGGEEFTIILPQTGEKIALDVAERVCRTVAATAIAHDDEKPVRMTISIGMACLPRADLDSRAALLQAADEALYAGKKRGKNRVEVSQGPSAHVQ